MVDAVKATGRQTNCKDDLDQFLLSLSAPPRSTSSAHVLTSAAVTNPYGEAVAALPPDVRGLLCVCMPYDNDDDSSSLNVEEKNVLSYIAGFIIRKLRSKMCSACKDKCVWCLTIRREELRFFLCKRPLCKRPWHTFQKCVYRMAHTERMFIVCPYTPL